MPIMRTNNQDGHGFLLRLAGFPARTFEKRFSEISTRMGLGALMSGEDLLLLYRAGFRAAICNVALNGLGGCDGKVLPEREGNRVRLECEFMKARGELFTSESWSALPAALKTSIRRVFLTVAVADDKLAW